MVGLCFYGIITGRSLAGKDRPAGRERPGGGREGEGGERPRMSDSRRPDRGKDLNDVGRRAKKVLTL